MSEQPKHVRAYTDGACIGNPGPGGYGIVLLYGQHRKELSGGFRLTTNNRIELMAAIAALRALTSPCQVTVYMDSRYLADAMSKGWAEVWQARGWRKPKKGKALNPDLRQQLLDLCTKHRVMFEWIEAHSGQPENERCDALSMGAAMRQALPPDLGYQRDDNVQKQRSLFGMEQPGS